VIAWAVVNQQIFVALIVGFLLYSGLRAGPEPGARPSQRDPADAGPTRPEVMDDPARRAPPSRPAEAPNDPPEFPI
jgi:hypothetical protein